jgi:eukaryotic-like serine/threonine-protein kinase
VAVTRGASRAHIVSWTLGTISTAVAIIFGTLYFDRPSVDVQPVQLSIVPPPNVRFNTSPDQTVAVVSPDGRQVAFVAASGGNSLLWVRALNTLEARPLAATAGAALPFWSPDSEAIGFFSGAQLYTIGVDGGSLLSVCSGVNNGRGGTWNVDGEIVFAATSNGTTGLFKVSAAGGQPTLIAKVDNSRGDLSYRYPAFLPDGRRFLFLAFPSNAIWLGSLDSNETTRLFDVDSQVEYASPGYLLFRRQGRLVAQPFDVSGAKLTGAAVPIAEGLATDANGYAAFSVSENGVLAYRTGAGEPVTQLSWFDRSGTRVGIVASPAQHRDPVLSPDDTRLAVEITDPQSRTQDIWIVDLKRDVTSRLTFDPANDIYPVWSPDGRQIVFSSDRGNGVFNLYQKRADGVGNDEAVVKSTQDMVPYSWSPDGSALVYRTRPGVINLGILPLVGDRKPYLFDPSKVTQGTGQVSPNGRWLAYHSIESGRYEVYVQSFPTRGAGKWQVSKDGAANARWRGDGRELFYYALDGQLMAAPITGATTVEVAAPIALFPARMLNGPTPVYPFRQQYDVTRDGQRFLLNVPVEEAASLPITVMINWTATLKK